LKPVGNFIIDLINGVAPRAGAWIETPAFGCKSRDKNVAPRAGAWIETRYFLKGPFFLCVAPRAGAWIETNHCLFAGEIFLSRPARARGLKLKLFE